MNPATIIALIGGITALITAVTALVIQIQHLRNHDQNGQLKPVDSPAKIGMINPGITDQSK